MTTPDTWPAAGVPAEWSVLEATPHGGSVGATPEDDDIKREARRFINTWALNGSAR